MTRRDAVDAAAVALAKLAVGTYVLTAGFSHISDDDYARVVIAEQLAHAPRLDPSGTSWLPFPFWLTGAAMAVFGRSITTARVATMLLAAAATAGVYLAMRAADHPRAVALFAVALGLLVPLDAWVGAATVPEAFTGALVAAAVLSVGGLAAPKPDAPTSSSIVPLTAAAALFAAGLSRYETWPACGLFAVYMGFVAVRSRAQSPRRAAVAAFAAVVAVAGPAAWMAWNAHAHGSATHFLDRVARYRVAIHAAPESLHARLVGYPEALLTTAPVVVGAFMVASVASVASVALAAFPAHRRARRRAIASPFALPLATAVTTLAFLVYGDVKDGAPTHHPERALLGIVWILAAIGASGIHALYTYIDGRFGPRAAARWTFRGFAAALAATLVANAAVAMRHAPGRDAGADRAVQLARGDALRAQAPAHLDVTPCSYEHFALLAAFGAPERATVHDAVAPDGSAAECPRVVVSP